MLTRQPPILMPWEFLCVGPIRSESMFFPTNLTGDCSPSWLVENAKEGDTGQVKHQS